MPSPYFFFVIASGLFICSSSLQIRPSRLDIVTPDYLNPPWNDPTFMCRSRKKYTNIYSSQETFICDPSSLLSEKQIDSLDDKLRKIYDGLRPYSLVDCAQYKTPRGFRVAVAMVRKMSFDSRTLADRAQHFAGVIFEKWGMQTECGAEVLVFFSLDDGQAYIKTGQLASKYLTERDIDVVYNKMLPYLGKNQVNKGLNAGVDKIGSYLSKYKGKEGVDHYENQIGPAQTSWHKEFTIVATFCLVLLIIGCCNGVGGTEAIERKKEMRQILRRLGIVRTEYTSAISSVYNPLTCPFCHDDLNPSWIPTVPTLPNDEDEEDANLLEDSPGRPLRTLRCGHTFHESCFDQEHPTPSDTVPACPVCGDQGGGSSTPAVMSVTREKDFAFRIDRLSKEHPNVLTPAVVAKLKSANPDEWPDPVTEAYLKPLPSNRRSGNESRGRENQTGSPQRSGNWFTNFAFVAIIIGAVSAFFGSIFSWGRRRRGHHRGYANIPRGGHGGGHGGSHGGGHGTSWGVNNSNRMGGGGGGGGHGASLGGGGGHGASFGNNSSGRGGGGGHGAGF